MLTYQSQQYYQLPPFGVVPVLTILTSDQKIENAITYAIHFFDKTIFTHPGPTTEQDSIILDCGRLLRMTYINKKHAYMILFQQQKKLKSIISKVKCKNVRLYLSNCLGTFESCLLPFHLRKQTHCIITAPPCMNLNITLNRQTSVPILLQVVRIKIEVQVSNTQKLWFVLK